MDFAPLLAALALAWKIVDLLKQLRVRDINAVVTQLVSWAAGVLVIELLAHTDFAPGVRVGSAHLNTLNTWSLVLVGLTVASLGSVTYDFKRAFDSTDSAAQPSLVSGLVPPSSPLAAPVVAGDPGPGVGGLTARARPARKR